MLNRLHTLQQDLGIGKSNYIIATSALFSIILYFYLLNITSFFQPTVYPLIDRVNYVIGFEDKYFTNNTLDPLIIVVCTVLWIQFGVINDKKYILMAIISASLLLALLLNIELLLNILGLISFPVILLLLTINKILSKKLISFDLRLCVNYVSIIGIIIATMYAFVIVRYILFPEFPVPSLNYLYYFYLIISVFSPIYLLLISFSYPLILVSRKIINTMRNSIIDNTESGIFGKKYVKLRIKIFHLSVIILLAVFISMIPHTSTINNDNEVIGSDIKHYVTFLESMSQSSSPGDLLYKAFVSIIGGDRPFSLLFFLSLSYVFNHVNFSTLLGNLPLLLGPFLVLSIYFLVLSITKDHLTALFASLITIPTHILIGIYAGLYANWFALIWGYLVLLYLFKLVDEPKRINFFIFSILLIILILSHAPTWTIFMYVIGLFLVVAFFKNKRRKAKTVICIFLATLPSIIIDITRMLLINSSGISQELDFAVNRDVGIQSMQTIWNNLIDTSHLIFAGQIGNPIILLLVVYWLYRTKIKENYQIFLLIFFSLFALPLLFAEKDIQSRFFFEIPIQIPAAIALTILKQRTGNFLPAAICLCLVVMSTYMAANFVLVLR